LVKMISAYCADTSDGHLPNPLTPFMNPGLFLTSRTSSPL
jgi:hypothetical protein